MTEPEIACRDVVSKLWKDRCLPECSHAGLVMSRYLQIPVKEDGHKEAKEALYQAMQKSIENSKELYSQAFTKYETGLTEFGICRRFKTKDGIHLVLGLGGENVLETGLTLHHLYGTPYIPGSALKGLAAHYCDQVLGAKENSLQFETEKEKRYLFKKGETYYKTLFGIGDDAGHIIFHDAWIDPKSVIDSFSHDIMTPHHGTYYNGTDAPTDFDAPNPVSFLSVSGTFLVAVSCDLQDENGKNWEKLAFDILKEALKEWGIGGKTNAGYGRMEIQTGDIIPVNPAFTSRLSIAGHPVSPAGRGNSVPMNYKIGDVVEVTREEDPHPKQGKVRSFFRAPDGIGGYFPGIINPNDEKVKLEIKSTYPEGRYDFILPSSHSGSQPGHSFGKSDTLQQKKPFSKKQG